jgi:hypothetical protein
MRGASSADWFETKAIRSYPHIHPPNAKGAITRAFTKQSGQPATRIYVLPSYRLIFLKEISNDFSIECSLFISLLPTNASEIPLRPALAVRPLRWV